MTRQLYFRFSFEEISRKRRIGVGFGPKDRDTVLYWLKPRTDIVDTKSDLYWGDRSDGSKLAAATVAGELEPQDDKKRVFRIFIAILRHFLQDRDPHEPFSIAYDDIEAKVLETYPLPCALPGPDLGLICALNKFHKGPHRAIDGTMWDRR